MYRFILILIFAISLSPIGAQDIRSNVEELSKRVLALEHELLYLKLFNEIKNVNSECDDLCDDLLVQRLTIEIQCRHNLFDSGLASIFEESYNLYRTRFIQLGQLMLEKAQVIDEVKSKEVFTSDEISALESELSYGMMIYRQQTGGALDLLKEVLDIYKRD